MHSSWVAWIFVDLSRRTQWQLIVPTCNRKQHSKEKKNLYNRIGTSSATADNWNFPSPFWGTLSSTRDDTGQLFFCSGGERPNYRCDVLAYHVDDYTLPLPVPMGVCLCVCVCVTCSLHISLTENSCGWLLVVAFRTRLLLLLLLHPFHSLRLRSIHFVMRLLDKADACSLSNWCGSSLRVHWRLVSLLSNKTSDSW